MCVGVYDCACVWVCMIVRVLGSLCEGMSVCEGVRVYEDMSVSVCECVCVRV